MLSTLRRLIKSGLRTPAADAGAGRAAPGSNHQRPRLLFAFHGGNKMRPGLGQQLYRHDAAFRRAVERCDVAAAPFLGFRLSDLFGGRDCEQGGNLAEIERRNIVILSALELALCESWRSRGVEPDASVGVSGGEVAAAYAAGALPLEESAAVLCSVARLVTERPLGGYLVWLDVDFEKALQLGRACPVPLHVSLEISPQSSLAYCTAAALPEAQRFLSARGVFRRAEATDWAHHTPWAEAALGLLADNLYRPRPRPLARPLYSSVTGDLIPAGAVLDADYWYRAAVTPILFGRAVCAALADGHGVVLNVCNHPTLRVGIEQSGETMGQPPSMLDSMRRGEPEVATWDESWRSLSAAGLVRARRAGEAQRLVSPPADAFAARGLNLSRPEVVRNPYPHYAALRRHGSVHFLPEHGFWLVLNYDDVAHVFKHPELFSSARKSAPFDTTLIEADPPGHTRVRRILSPSFSPQRIQALEDYARDCAAELLARGGERGGFDLVNDFADPLTESVLFRLLGLPRGETESLRRRLRAHKLRIEETSRILDAWLAEYLSGLREAGGDDLCSRLLRGDGEERLAPEEVASVIKLLWLAGTDTTSMLISTSALLLLRHPDARAAVQDEPTLLPAFVEEALRLEAPAQFVARFARETVELSGVVIPAGAAVKPCIAAANRDPAHFADPDSLSLRRSPNNHLAFAAGPHFCLGAMLARVQARVALETLLAAWPDFAPARPLPTISYADSIQFRALKNLFVRAA